MNEEEADKRAKDNPVPQSNRGYKTYKGKEEEKLVWGVILFGLIGATITTFAVTHVRSTVDNIYAQWSRSQALWKNGRSSWTNFQEEARKRYYRRMQEEHDAEMERVERIRRMQSVFNRQKNKKRRSYDSWQQHGPDPHHEHFQRNEWYWKEDNSFKDHGTNFGQTFKVAANSPLSHHYSVLGLDRLRTKPYTDAEIKSAFRTKAKEFHPDQNQDNKEVAEAMFKEVMVSYEAIKSERKKNGIH